jgi:hypothetical protein
MQGQSQGYFTIGVKDIVGVRHQAASGEDAAD